MNRSRLSRVRSTFFVAAVATAAVLVGCAGESSDDTASAEGAATIQMEKGTALELKSEVTAARDSARLLRHSALELTRDGRGAQWESPIALQQLEGTVTSSQAAVRRLRDKLLAPNARPGSRFANVPDAEVKRVQDRLADVADAYFEKLKEEIPALANKIVAREAISDIEKAAVHVHVLDVLQNLNFALRTVNEWIAEADNTAIPRCAGTNVWGSYPPGGSCTIFGCASEGGACNLFGCFERGGSCVLTGCTKEIEPGTLLCRPR